MSQDLKLIPLNKLSASKLNVRKTNRKADIKALAASIAAHGLLQNLSVISTTQDRYEVVAGGRRLAALKLLSASGAVAKDHPVPCFIMKPEDAGETSLAENIQRVAMDAMDEVDAFASFFANGSSIDDIARRFGCGVRHVEQRLALARLSPKLKAAYRRGDLSLDAARAFCIVDDHSRQEDVFKALGRRVMYAPGVRNHLMHGAMGTNDRVARFVGLEAYEAAGGHITRDLFTDSEAYIDDPALMTRLASARLELMGKPLLEEGWKWVRVNLNIARLEGRSGDRIHPTRRALTHEEREVLAALDATSDALEVNLEEAKDDDKRWLQVRDLTVKRDALLQATQEWDPELMKVSGVAISIDHEGQPSYAYGIVDKDDVKTLRRIQKERARTAACEHAQGGNNDATSSGGVGDAYTTPEDEPAADLPKALTRELTAARTCAIRQKINEGPDLALAVAVFALSRRAITGYPAAGIGVDLRATQLPGEAPFMDAHSAFVEGMPPHSGAALSWCIAQTRQTLLEVLALLISRSIDLAHEGASRDDAQKQDLADRLAIALNLDMSEYWRPDIAFWSRLPKQALIRAHLTAPAMLALSDAERAAFQNAQVKRTKAEIAQAVAQALDATNWLPDVFVASSSDCAFELTDSGRAAIAAE